MSELEFYISLYEIHQIIIFFHFIGENKDIYTTMSKKNAISQNNEKGDISIFG